MERVTSKMVEDKKEYDLRLQEYAQLLDIRAERIKVISFGRTLFFKYCFTSEVNTKLNMLIMNLFFRNLNLRCVMLLMVQNNIMLSLRQRCEMILYT